VKPPEQVIRDYLERHGPVELRYDSLEETWEEGPLTPQRRREVAGDLERAGVVCEPPLENLAAQDLVTVSLAPAEPVARRALGWLVAVPLILMAVGVLGPWAENVFATEQGIDADGWIVLAAGAAGTLLLGLYWTGGGSALLPPVAALAGAGAAAVVTSAFRDYYDDALVSPAWGLYVSFAGAALLVGLAMASLVRR
jgi:hypothetical protein